MDKHNWFTIDGTIRTKENMTTKEFLNLLDSLGLEFMGMVKYDQDFNDSIYNLEKIKE